MILSYMGAEQSAPFLMAKNSILCYIFICQINCDEETKTAPKSVRLRYLSCEFTIFQYDFEVVIISLSRILNVSTKLIA